VHAHVRVAAMTGADGVPAADLVDRVPELTDDAIVDAMIVGVGAMEPIAISEELARDVLAYLREKFPSP
jgi:hypothetical protein